ncbi:MGMT family protein [Candidatus Woesearchaeota archaeon]|nr:MGMT family protein [Candidatus Woesearchaeota archaeon]
MKTKQRVTEFERQVYDLCSKVPKGSVTSYKEIAHAMHTKAYRAVGAALRSNPYAPKVPCHRVVASNGTLGGFQGSINPRGHSLRKKASMLTEEGLEINKGRIKEFEERLFKLQ